MAKAGDKRRLEVQTKRVRWLRLSIIIVLVVHLVVRLVVYRASAGKRHWAAFGATALIQLGCFRALAAMAAPRYGSHSELISGGTDIQTAGAYYFDAIYLTMIVQIGSVYSGYFWFTFLAVPVFCLWQVWVLVMQPYMASASVEAPGETEALQKKREKAERQQRRLQGRR